MISIATGGEQSLARAPAVATVITAKDIEAMGAQNLDQVLEMVPGLHVSLSSIRFNPIYMIRGIYTDRNPHVLMLINGVPMTQLWQGDRGIHSTLPVSDISRVEVIRGPGSAVYGADAFAGVINLITKSASEKQGLSIEAMAGSFETYGASVLYGSKDNEYWGFDIGFSLEYFETEGDRDRIIEEDAQTYFDSLRGTHASHAPGAADTRQQWIDTRLDLKHDKVQIRLWNWQRKDMGVGPGLAQALDPSGRGDVNNYLADVTYHDPWIAKNMDFKTVFSYMDINTTSSQVLFPKGTVLPINSDGNVGASPNLVSFPDGYIGNPSIFEEHLRLDLSLFYTGINKHRFRTGAGFLKAKARGEESKNFGPGVIDGSESPIYGSVTDVTGTENAFFTSAKRNVYYLSLQDEWNFAADWDLTVGLRYDDYSDFGNTVNPRAALVWHPEYNLTTKLLYGRAFRPPSFQELFVKNNPVAQGNTDLKPEVIQTTELAFDYLPVFDLRTTLNVFYYEINDLIKFGTEDNPIVAQNVGGQEGYGLEWEFDWALAKTFSILANYAFQRAEQDSHDAGHAPTHQVFLQSRWEVIPKWFLNLQISSIMDRKRVENDSREQIEDYTMVDFILRGDKFVNGLTAELALRNLFDEDAREPSPVDSFIPNDYPLPGRSINASVKYDF
jgi:iron complex outermembrane receptor protein